MGDILRPVAGQRYGSLFFVVGWWLVVVGGCWLLVVGCCWGVIDN